MRFGLLCDDPWASPIVDLLGALDGEHRLNVAVSRTRPATAPPSKGWQAVSFVDHWEDMVTASDIDAILAGGSDPQILEGIKQLATAGLPMLFAPQAAQGSTFIYELSLVRDDNHVTLFPVFWHRFDAAVIHLKNILSEGALGRIQFLLLNRSLTRASASSPISQTDVDAELLHDTDLVRWLVGDYDQVTAMRTDATNDAVLMESVVLAGRSLPQANWSIGSIDGPAQWKLTVRGESGIAELQRDGSSRSWICEINGQQVTGDELTTARKLLEAFAAAIPNAAVHEASSANTVSSEWGELVKCFETVDATHRSVRRRRTIELHFEPMSERAIFKTQMTAIGCGLLVATFLLTLCYLGIASLIPLPSGVLIALRTLVFAPLVIFLVAQILLPLTRPSSSERLP